MSQQASQAASVAEDEEGANVPDQQMEKTTQMANAIRALSMDAVQAANSGHPGLPMGAADIATVLFTRIMKFDATAPNWADRDRFVLSAGHGSMLLYSALHLLGVEVVAQLVKDQPQVVERLGQATVG